MRVGISEEAMKEMHQKSQDEKQVFMKQAQVKRKAKGWEDQSLNDALNDWISVWLGMINTLWDEWLTDSLTMIVFLTWSTFIILV